MLSRYRNVEVVLGDVTGVDMAARRVILRDGPRLPFDRLVLAAGSNYNYFGHDDWAEAAPGPRSIEDARTMRQTGRPTLPVTLAGEATTNPFLRVDEDALITAVTHRLGRAPADRVETFATLRQWKNDFRA